MRSLLNAKWLFLVNTLPILVLFFLFASQFNLIKSLLEPDTIALWTKFSVVLGVLGGVNFLYALFITITKKEVSAYYSIIALVLYISFIYVYGYHSDSIIPFSIPNWMVSDDMILYVGTFLMPTLAYALIVLVTKLTPEHKEFQPWKSFASALAVPALWYFFYLVIAPLWRTVESQFSEHVVIVMLILATLLFLFFLVRGLFIVVTKKTRDFKKYQLFWKIPIALLFPVLGLFLNNTWGYGMEGIFGNFTNYWFYVIAVVNALIICLPNPKHKLYHLVLFAARSITFTYTLYFFLVFLPFLPLSIFALVVVGAGFLMLSPLFLFVIHINELSIDFKYLSTAYSKTMLSSIAIACVLVIPFFVSVSYLKDKSTLTQTLDYLYTPDYEATYTIDVKSLKETLQVLRQHKESSSHGILERDIPYLSTYYNWLVLDNLTLSDAKIKYIEEVFFGSSSLTIPNETLQNKHVDITNTQVQSTYDEVEKVWKSWLNIEITNKSGDEWANEFVTNFELPAGCWISDYYLYIGDKKEIGMLAEKKSAMWVFSQIRGTNLDPGILHYLSGNKVAFRVFPIFEGEVRKTGIQFIHKEPLTLAIDGLQIRLGNDTKSTVRSVESDEMAYVSSADKQTLASVQRQPYFHFLVDASKNINTTKADIQQSISQVLNDYPTLQRQAKVSRVNRYETTMAINEDWPSMFNDEDFAGGFFLDRAIKITLVQSYKLNSDSYPVMVVLSDSLDGAVLSADFADLAISFPENKWFYELTKSGQLIQHSLMNTPKLPTLDSLAHPFYLPSLKYITTDKKAFYVSDNDEPSIVLKTDFVSINDAEVKERNWLSAFMMQGNWISQNLSPSASQNEWLSLVKSSFYSRVMTPVTSYLVVENEAQKAMLMKKQEQVLAGNKSLDVGEDVQSMSEPGFVIVGVLLVLILWFRKKRKVIPF